MKLAEFQNVRDSINQQYDHDTQLLEKLQRTNVYNDTFCISHDGKFGTINGLRLGRLSNVPVDWPEINAAWGHALLLLQTVADQTRVSSSTATNSNPWVPPPASSATSPLLPPPPRAHHPCAPLGPLKRRFSSSIPVATCHWA